MKKKRTRSSKVEPPALNREGAGSSPAACTMHTVQELNNEGQWVYPYRCSRCGGCFLCAHTLIDYAYWVCADGYRKPTLPDPGVLVSNRDVAQAGQSTRFGSEGPLVRIQSSRPFS